ncbi:hypothetical protein TEA_018267 [Camellia sinensis var. sinensis]|uniref:peptidylprolyl isomerase n=1 Tax=Camellia sinensis var. sinensis TaxID=542762 RepID=A0A4V3WK55_CAMSN|nr:hypothetical protein TEA_018267 [Camellia sinensis var. sinensis]
MLQRKVPMHETPFIEGQKPQNTLSFSHIWIAFSSKEARHMFFLKNADVLHYNKNLRRTFLFLLASLGFFPTLPSSGKTKNKNPYDEKRLLEQNKRVQRENNAPEDFPNFVREGFQVNVVTTENYVKSDSGLIYRDFEVGKGDCPKDGQQVTFHYVGYNESGRRIDSTYLQGTPAKIRMGTKALVPGFEEGIQDMRPGGKRRIIIPPELGPPVSAIVVPSTGLINQDNPRACIVQWHNPNTLKCEVGGSNLASGEV